MTDMHVCPMVTPGLPPIPHVGGPVTGPGAPTVMIGGMPAATVGDMCVCVGPPDSIIMGSFTVLIGGKPAARMGDSTAHGGTIVLGCPNVLIGEAGGPGGPAVVTPPVIAIIMKNAQLQGGDVAKNAAQIISMKEAAQTGQPFCEICQ